MSFRAQLEEHLFELAWRQWTALGVAGVQRAYGKVAIAPEELIILTATLAVADPRLRDEAMDWCTRYGDFVSTPRLKNLLRAMPAGTTDAFAPFGATVNASSRMRWPASGKPWRVKLSGKSKLPTLDQPALLHLRLRGLFGVTARADVIAAFLSRSDPRLSAADLVELGYTKRNIAQTLDSLATSGLLRATRVRNQVRFEWAKRDELARLVEPLPDRIPRWPVIIRFVIGLQELAVRLDPKSDTVAGVEAVKFLRDFDLETSALNLQPPPPASLPAETWSAFQKWAVRHTSSLARGTSPMLVSR